MNENFEILEAKIIESSSDADSKFTKFKAKIKAKSVADL
jgi:hypothetical protein